MTKAFLAVEGDTAAGSSRIHEKVALLTKKIADTFLRRFHGGGTMHIEEVQDQVELELMRTAEYKVAKAYVLYREERRRARDLEQKEAENKKTDYVLHVTLLDGSVKPLDMVALQQRVQAACEGLSSVSSEFIIEDVKRNLFDKVPVREVKKALVMSARTMIEKESNYTYVTARLLLDDLYSEAFFFLDLPMVETQNVYQAYFETYLDTGIQHELLDPRLKTTFDLAKIRAAIKPERDLQFTYLGLQTLYDRYFIHWKANVLNYHKRSLCVSPWAWLLKKKSVKMRH